jgi:hypothetical protein
VASTLGTGYGVGVGTLFGASALSGSPENYIAAFRHFNNLSMSILPLGKTSLTTLAFTPVLESQIQAGRRMGGNAIDPPLESYAAVQFQTQFMQGVNSSEVPDEVQQARLLFFEQCVSFLSRWLRRDVLEISLLIQGTPIPGISTLYERMR